MTQLEICHKWVARLGFGFHPDTRGPDYRPHLSAQEQAEYERDMDALFELSGDPYAAGIEAMRQWEQNHEGIQ